MGAIPVIAEAAPWSPRSPRAASAITGTLSAKADRSNVLKADTSICCQHFISRTVDIPHDTVGPRNRQCLGTPACAGFE